MVRNMMTRLDIINHINGDKTYTSQDTIDNLNDIIDNKIGIVSARNTQIADLKHRLGEQREQIERLGRAKDIEV